MKDFNRFNFEGFSKIICIDAEYKHSYSKSKPEVHCIVAKDLFSGAVKKKWVDEIDDEFTEWVCTDSLFIAYNAVAELSCLSTLKADFPLKILDLFVEFRNLTNGTNICLL